MFPDPVIRPATRADLPAMEWNGEFAHYRRLYQDIYLSYERGEALLWIADLPGRGVIGQVFVQLISGRLDLADGARRAYVYGFRIQPAYRCQGLGTRMMARVESDLLLRGFRYVTLNVTRDNEPARLLYERLGYQVIAIEPGRWSYTDELGKRVDVNEPSWRMQKDLAIHTNPW